MGDLFLIAGGPYFDAVLALFLVFIVCPILTVTFCIASRVQFARKKRKPALVFALLSLQFALPLLYLAILTWIRQ